MSATADDTVLEAILRRDRQVVVALIVVIAMAWLWILLGAGRHATAAVELRRAGLSLGGFGIVSGLCPLAAGLVAEEIGAAPDDQCYSTVDLPTKSGKSG